MSMLGNKTLLVVEDDAVLRASLVRAFSRRGYQVQEAESVASVAAVVEEAPPDLAVVDLKLEDGTGLEVISQLRKASADTRILILTGFASIATAVEAVKLGATNYIAKPATPDEILCALDTVEPDMTKSIARTPPSVARLEWEHIQRVLKENDGNISATARALRMHRRTLQRKLLKRPVRE